VSLPWRCTLRFSRGLAAPNLMSPSLTIHPASGLPRLLIVIFASLSKTSVCLTTVPTTTAIAQLGSIKLTQSRYGCWDCTRRTRSKWPQKPKRKAPTIKHIHLLAHRTSAPDSVPRGMWPATQASFIWASSLLAYVRNSKTGSRTPERYTRNPIVVKI
jgi:hypothetical protein